MERIIYLKGDRISLVIPEKQDVNIMYLGINNFEISKNLGELNRFYFENEEKFYDSLVLEQKHFFVIMKNDTKEIIGGIGFNDFNKLSRNAEVGICIYLENELGKGYGTDAMKLFLKYTFEIVGCNKLKLGVFDFNKRGVSSYLKCGFKEVGILKQEAFIAGAYRDSILMEIMKDEYLQ
ncbi:MAG: GNAT family protein [Candidatus Gracilibacteria bacterium]|nr:GNAT family protein [Candidatus Gracilibacteria bacterium]MDD2908699.1 GNAT family protein [Candidatus Gracilibacteria bacterium]